MGIGGLREGRLAHALRPPARRRPRRHAGLRRAWQAGRRGEEQAAVERLEQPAHVRRAISQLREGKLTAALSQLRAGGQGGGHPGARESAARAEGETSAAFATPSATSPTTCKLTGEVSQLRDRTCAARFDHSRNLTTPSATSPTT